MDNIISPKYQMQLAKDVHDGIWKVYPSYKEVRFYVEKWHDEDERNDWENFRIAINDRGNLDLLQTLNNMDGETLLKVAIDIGVETPDFIPSVPMFRNVMKSDYRTASATFEKAFRQVEEHPDMAIGLANSALESIIKEILKDGRIVAKSKSTDTLYTLATELLKTFLLFPSSEMPLELKTIGSSLLSITQSIEKLRSEKTYAHGKTSSDYVIHDSLYAYFVINSVTTLGLFLNSYYIKKFPKIENTNSEDDDLPF